MSSPAKWKKNERMCEGLCLYTVHTFSFLLHRLLCTLCCFIICTWKLYLSIWSVKFRSLFCIISSYLSFPSIPSPALPFLPCCSFPFMYTYHPFLPFLSPPLLPSLHLYFIGIFCCFYFFLLLLVLAVTVPRQESAGGAGRGGWLLSFRVLSVACRPLLTSQLRWENANTEVLLP